MVSRRTRCITFDINGIDYASVPEYVDCKVLREIEYSEFDELDRLVSELISFLKKHGIEYTYSDFVTNTRNTINMKGDDVCNG